MLPLLGFALSYHHDPRKFRTGLYLLAALAWLALLSVTTVVNLAAARDEYLGGVLLLAVVVLAAVMVLAFAVFLVVTGLTLIRREGVAISRFLSLGVGLVLLGYLGLVGYLVWSDSLVVFQWILLLGLPAAYFGFAFTSFLLYGSLYPRLMARRRGPVAAVVVLGSGLLDGQVPPLLASRLRSGRQVFDKLATSGTVPVLVTSGGQGEDEPVAEAVAMARFLIDEGFPPEKLLVEDRSVNTWQNLDNSRSLLAERGLVGPVVAVTSDFHAFRAALLLRRLGMDGWSVGAPTARYYWPSAVIREFLAILRDHLWLNLVLVGLTLIPLLIAVGFRIAELFG